MQECTNAELSILFTMIPSHLRFQLSAPVSDRLWYLLICNAFHVHDDCAPPLCSVASEHNLLSDAGAEIGGMESPWEYKHRQGTAQKAMRKNVNGGRKVGRGEV